MQLLRPLFAGIFMGVCAVVAACGDSSPASEVPEIEPPVPEDQGSPPVPDPTSEIVGDSCATHFTSNDATTIFGVAGVWAPAACTFDGVNVHGNTVSLRWTDPKDRTVRLDIAARGCGEGTPVGDYLLVTDPIDDSVCTGLIPSVKEALTDGSFPAPTGSRSADALGPDGDGVPGPRVPATPPKQPVVPG